MKLDRLALAALMSLVHCGSEVHPGYMGDSTGSGPPIDGPCTNGATRDCHETIGVNGGVLSCFAGTQICSNGAWGKCGGPGTVSGRPFTGSFSSAVTPGALKIQNLGGPSTCATNPCDPYCSNYQENPDGGVQPDASLTVVDLNGGSLGSSNVPAGFQSKGNDPSNVCGGCASTDTSVACQSACQFDMHCDWLPDGGASGNNGCVGFAAGESGACNGIDVTAPVPCENGGQRMLSVCNRGTVAAPPGIQCWTFPGNSPQYPNANPGTGDARVMTTQTTIQPGACEYQAIDESVFPSSGTASVMCNPPVATTTTLPSAGAYAYATGTWFAGNWQSTDLAYQASGGAASLPLVNTSATPTYAGAIATAGSATDWTLPTTNLLGAADGVVAKVNIGGTTTTSTDYYPSTASATSGTWNNATNAVGSTSGTFATTTLAYSTGTAQAPAFTSVDAASGLGSWMWNGYSLPASVGTSGDGTYASSTIPAKSGSTPGSSALFAGFASAFASIPSGATLTNASAAVVWKTSDKGKVSGSVQLYHGSSAIGCAGCAAKSPGSNNAYATLTYASWTQSELASLTASDLASGTLLRFVASNSASSTNTVTVDAISLTISYIAPSSAQLTLGGFGVAGIPSGQSGIAVTVTAVVDAGVASANDKIKVEAFAGTTPYSLGSQAVTGVATGAGTTVTFTNSVPVASPADLASLYVVVTASTINSATASFTAGVDSVKVNVSYSDGAANPQTIQVNSFGLQSLVPSNAIIGAITTEVGWSASDTKVTLAAQPRAGTTSIGSPLTDASPPSVVAGESVTYTNSSNTFVWNDLSDARFNVLLTASRSGSGQSTASIDYVKVTVTYATYRTSTMDLDGFGFSVPNTATQVSATIQIDWDVANTATGTQLCLQPYNEASGASLGTAYCTTSGQSPPLAFGGSPPNATATFGGLSYDDANNLAVAVTATRAAGTTTTTANVDYVRAEVAYTTSATQVAECNYQNDWTVTKSNPTTACQSVTTGSYATTKYTQQYQPTCATGFRVQWGYLAYSATTPSDASGTSDVRLQVQTAPVLSNGTLGMATALFTAADTPAAGDPAYCPMSGPAPCPKNLYNVLGGLPAAQYGELSLVATLIPAPDGNVGPTLNSWTIAYDCVPGE